MRLHRFYVAQPLGEEVVILDVSLIKQWAKVFRYTKGDLVVLFDGSGTDVTYIIDTISHNECILHKSSSSLNYIPKKKITLYLSLIKKDNFELAAQKATELGVSSIVPIISERSEKKGLNEERLQKILIESAEQCGRGDIPTLLPIIDLRNMLEMKSLHDMLLVSHMTGISLSEAGTLEKATSIGIFVGPEGGWSEPEELLFKEHDVTSVSLGKTVLRAETAAIVGTALLLQ
jgi:16S rRNA (uracil1498-N3)-methyltransferase